MQRLRHRPSHFMHRGNRLAFHRFQDGATLARLDPYADGEQVWLLHSGRDIAVTAAEVRDISKQVHGLDLPETRPDGGTCNCGARLDDIERRLAALEARADPAPNPPLSEALETSLEENPGLFGGDEADPRDEELAVLRARVAELEASPPPSPAVAALEEMERVKAKLDEGRAPVPADLSEALAGEDVSSPSAIQKLTERLNIEKAELRRERAAGDMPTDREKQVDRLLNWLAQFGEA